MTFEVEQKFRVADPAAVERGLAALGAEFGAAVAQVDRYYAHPSRDFAATDEALRIRSVGGANFVTYKGPKIDSITKTRREIELPLEAGAAGANKFATLLEALGFRFVAEVRKQRRAGSLAWRQREVHAALDEVIGLGAFVELETTADEAALAAARECISSLSQHLGLSHGERRSYLELLLAKGRLER